MAIGKPEVIVAQGMAIAAQAVDATGSVAPAVHAMVIVDHAVLEAPADPVAVPR